MLHEDNCKPIREAFEFWDLVRLILEILQYVLCVLDLWSTCSVQMNFAITVSADGLAPFGARPSAGIVLVTTWR